MLLLSLDLQFFAHKKGGGSASTNRSHDSRSKRLGVKKFGGELVKGGNIIRLQRGTEHKTGSGTYLGKTYAIHAKYDGIVYYYTGRKKRTYVKVLPLPEKII